MDQVHIAQETISKIFHMELNNLIGSKQQINIRRRKLQLLDLIQDVKDDIKPVSSGSGAEGFKFTDSDIDDMNVYKQFLVFPPDSENINIQSDQVKFILRTDGVKPGFAMIEVKGDFNNKEIPLLLRKSVVKVDQAHYLSSELLVGHSVNHLNTYFPGTTLHGPCSNFTEEGMEVDHLVCLQCNVWPVESNIWKDRVLSKNWPPRSIVKELIEYPWLLVPIGSRNSPTHHLEWRMSFTAAEKKLVHSMNHVQFLCYGLMKLFLKHVIEKNEDIKGLLCSYFLKTCLFYTTEQESFVWEEGNLLPCFWNCLKKLIHWVQEGDCPNYIIQQNNMFAGKIYGIKQQMLLQHLLSLYDEGVTCLYQIPMLKDIPKLVDMIQANPQAKVEFLENEKETELDCDQEIFSFHLRTVHGDLNYYNKIISKISETKLTLCLSETDNDILDGYFHIALQGLARNMATLALQTNKKNNNIYRLLQASRQMFVECIKFDICSGWLHLATFFYVTGQYSYVLNICKYVLSQLQFCKMYIAKHGILVHIESYLDTMCGLNLTRKQKCKSAVAYSVLIFKHNSVYPQEILHEIEMLLSVACLSIPPSVYSHFLNFLCHFHTKNTEQRNTSLKHLEQVVKGKHLMYKNEEAISNTLLGICFQMMHRYPEAIHAFQTSLRFQPDRNSALLRLSYLLLSAGKISISES